MLMEVLLAIAIISIVIPAAVSVILSSNMVEITGYTCIIVGRY